MPKRRFGPLPPPWGPSPPQKTDVEIYVRVATVKVDEGNDAQKEAFHVYANATGAAGGRYIALDASAPAIDGADNFDFEPPDKVQIL